MRKTVFAEIFIFASFGNRRFSKIRVGASFSSFSRTRLDSRKLVPILIFGENSRKIREKSRKNREKRVFSCFSFSRKKWRSTRLDSRKLVPTRKPTRNFEFKFGMQDPKQNLCALSIKCFFFLNGLLQPPLTYPNPTQQNNLTQYS